MICWAKYFLVFVLGNKNQTLNKSSNVTMLCLIEVEYWFALIPDADDSDRISGSYKMIETPL